MAPTDYSIADASALTGTPVRTIRYYLAEGLLPSSGKVGPASRYDEAFVARLRAIRQLQERHLPLAEIRKALEGMPDATVIAAVGPEEAPPRGSAAEYVRRVLGVSEEQVAYDEPSSVPASPSTPGLVRPSTAAPNDANVLFASMPIRKGDESAAGVAGQPPLSASGRFVPPDPDAQPFVAQSVGWAYAIPAEPHEPAAAERSHWERIAIAPDIEIHIRRPLSRPSAKRAERLIEAARDIFDKGA